MGGPPIFRQLHCNYIVCLRWDYRPCLFLWSSVWSTSLQFLSAAHILPSPRPYYLKFVPRILKHEAQLTSNICVPWTHLSEECMRHVRGALHSSGVKGEIKFFFDFALPKCWFLLSLPLKFGEGWWYKWCCRTDPSWWEVKAVHKHIPPRK